MPGNSQRKGAIRKGASRKGPLVGSGGQKSRALQGKGPTPKAEDRDLMDFVGGPDFPTGGVLVDSRESIAQAYATGRGSFRIRASITVEKEKGGGAGIKEFRVRVFQFSGH